MHDPHLQQYREHHNLQIVCRGKTSQIPAKFPSMGSLVWGQEEKGLRNTENEQRGTKNLDKIRQNHAQKSAMVYQHIFWQQVRLVISTPDRKGGRPWRSTVSASKSDRGVHILGYIVIKEKHRKEKSRSNRNQREIRHNNPTSLPGIPPFSTTKKYTQLKKTGI